ncbi:hypothetical protein FXV77_02020 [Sphingobacterium phlebotomi]|uniref:Uncharacterized protein n=1 Tax=Sphingobacterium phlebotomi TaxID=2605433 RepID=A0A5D4HA73_9SPHI|nr:hypothetical protein [Sphingobacterium phlebotomi]TYR38081.1 hypothetical protein FXV77_02020 [Sphingobacterium phlebotomi]
MKKKQKIKAEYGFAIFPYLFLNRMELASLRQHSVFNGIAFTKMAAKQYKAVLARATKISQ